MCDAWCIVSLPPPIYRRRKRTFHRIITNTVILPCPANATTCFLLPDLLLLLDCAVLPATCMYTTRVCEILAQSSFLYRELEIPAARRHHGVW